MAIRTDDVVAYHARVSVRISVISVGISVRVSDRSRQFKTKFWFSSGLLCFWDASGFFLHEPMWNPCWFHMNIYELCKQTSHMDCFNACLLWQKLGSIKWQGLTPCMTYKMTQGVTNAGWQKPGSIKWQVLYIHISLTGITFPGSVTTTSRNVRKFRPRILKTSPGPTDRAPWNKAPWPVSSAASALSLDAVWIMCIDLKKLQESWRNQRLSTKYCRQCIHI